MWAKGIYKVLFVFGKVICKFEILRRGFFNFVSFFFFNFVLFVYKNLSWFRPVLSKLFSGKGRIFMLYILVCCILYCNTVHIQNAQILRNTYHFLCILIFSMNLLQFLKNGCDLRGESSPAF